MKRRVVVTGLGAVTSLSCQVEDLWKRILAGESGIHTIRLFDTTGHKVHFGGDISEIWVQSVARSADWIRFAAANQSIVSPPAQLLK